MSAAGGKWLTVPEVASRFLVGLDSVEAWVRSGRLPARRDGSGRYLVREADAVALMNDARRYPQHDKVTDPEGAQAPSTRNAPLDPENRRAHQRRH